MTPTRDIQARLADLGYDPGPVDGIRGRRTVSAIKAFQKDKGLAADGIVGPLTRAKLFEGTTSAPAPGDGSRPDLPWLEEASRLLGTKEKPGPGSNGQILDWARDLEVAYGADDIPWCGLFVGHCVGATLPDEELPGSVLWARAWRRFGKPCEPTRGAIMVFWRGRPDASTGHVAFYVGEDEESYYVLGGNQSDKVSVARIRRERLLDARFPATAPYGERQTVRLEPKGDAFSTREA